jgi:hypothetical protein
MNQFYKLRLAQIKEELEKGRLTVKGAVLYTTRIAGWKRPVPIGKIQEITGVTRTSLYRALEALEKEGEITRERGWVFPKTGKEFPETGKEFPEMGKEFPETGKEFPEMGIKRPESQTESGKRETIDIADKVDKVDKIDKDDEKRKLNQKGKENQDHQERNKRTEKENQTQSVRGQNSAAAPARDREKSEESEESPPTHPRTPTEQTELENWIIREKIPLLPNRPLMPRAVARSLSKHAEIREQFAEWKQRNKPAPPAPPVPKTEEEILEQRRAIIRGLIRGGLRDLAKKRMDEWGIEEEEIWSTEEVSGE